MLFPIPIKQRSHKLAGVLFASSPPLMPGRFMVAAQALPVQQPNIPSHSQRQEHVPSVSVSVGSNGDPLLLPALSGQR